MKIIKTKADLPEFWWCHKTRDNWDSLVELGIDTDGLIYEECTESILFWDGNSKNWDIDGYCGSSDIKYFHKKYPGREEIGFVTHKIAPCCEFGKYGFKVPDFDAKIYFQTKHSGEYYGTVDGVAMSWESNGKACLEDIVGDDLDGLYRPEYDLEVLKPHWWENADEKECRIVVVGLAQDDERMNILFAEDFRKNENLHRSEGHTWRYASDEEIDTFKGLNNE